MGDWEGNVHGSILVKLWCFTLDQFYPCPGICIASTLEVVAAFGGEEAEEVLAATFRVFEVSDGVEIIETDLFEKALFGGRFVEREEVGAQDQVEGFPLLREDALVECMFGIGLIGPWFFGCVYAPHHF